MTIREAAPLPESALLQQRLWGGDPRGWADFAEPHTTPLFEAVLTAAGAGEGTRLLDVGCGTGLLLQLAEARGAAVSGIDATPGLLAIAAERVPAADLWLADMEALPFADASFDCVVGVNAFAFAADPVHALREAARVTVAGGALVVGMFAEPDRSEATAVHVALSAISPPQRQGDHAPYALSEPGNLEAALTAAGLEPTGDGEVPLDWDYADVVAATRGLMSSAGAARAIEDAGAAAVRVALERAFAPFTDEQTGRVVMHNTLRWVSARRSSS